MHLIFLKTEDQFRTVGMKNLDLSVKKWKITNFFWLAKNSSISYIQLYPTLKPGAGGVPCRLRWVSSPAIPPLPARRCPAQWGHPAQRWLVHPSSLPYKPVLRIQRHWIWIRNLNFGPFRTEIQIWIKGNVFNFEEQKCIKFKRKRILF